MKHRLTGEEFETLVRTSRKKAKKIIDKSKKILDNPENGFVKKFTEALREFLDSKVDEARDKEAYKEGWAKKDPYNLINYWVLFPTIKKRWLDKDITTYQIEKEYDTYAVNEMIEEELGKDKMKEFLKVYGEVGYWYYKKLETHGIYQKLWKKDEVKKPQMNGFHKSIPRQILGKMRKFRKKGNCR